MFAELRTWLRPPEFKREEEQRVANTLYTLLLITLIGSVLVTVIRLASGELLATAIGFAGVAVGSAVLLNMVRRGALTAPSYAMPLMMLVALLYLTGNDQGVHDIGMPALALVIVLAGLVLGRQGVLVFTILTTVGALGLGLAEISGMLSSVYSDLTGYDDLLLVGIEFAFIGVVTYVLVDNLQLTLSRVRETNQDLQALSSSLEAKVSDRTRDLALAAEVGQSISRIRELDRLLGNAVELIQARFQLYYAQIYLVDAERRQLVLYAGAGDVGRRLQERGHTLPIDAYSINGRAASTREPVIVPNTRQNPLFQPNSLLPHTNAELAIPLIAGERVVGVLDLQSRDMAALGEEMLDAFEILAGQLAVAIESAHLFTELEEAEQDAARERGLLNSLINSVPDLIFYKDLDGVYLGCNVAFSEFAGVSEEELVGKTDFDLFDHDVAEFFREQDRIMLEEGVARRNEEWVDYPDGRHVLLETLKTPIYNDAGDQLGLIGISRNITERYQAEADLARRVAELNCLNDIGRRSEAQLPLPEFLTWTAERIPAAMPHPEDCVAAITLNEQVYGRSQALALSRQIVEGLRIGGELIGRLYISYTDESLSFVDEDSAFIGGIGRRVSSYIETQRLLASIQEHADEMRNVTEIGAAIAAIRQKSRLLQQVVDLTQEKFALYHTHIYLLEPERQELRLRAGSGEKGRQMVSDRHRISLYRQRSVVAQAARERTPAAVENTTEDPTFLPHPLLPETRAELALPLVAGDELLGVFDVQSDRVGHFDPETQNIFASLATQITVALQNAEQYEQTQQALNEIRALQQASAQEGWQAFLTARRRSIAGYVARREEVAPIVAGGGNGSEEEGSAAHLEELAGAETAVANPVAVSGATVGRLGVNLPPGRSLDEDERELLQSISQQVGQALERARLSEQTQQALTETATLYEIGTQVTAAQDFNDLVGAIAPSLTSSTHPFVSASLFTIETDVQGKPAELHMTATNDAALHRFLARPLPVDQFPASQLWVNNPDVLPLIEDVAADPRLDENGRDFYADTNAKSTALLPLRVGESWVGLFVLIWPGEQKRFSEDDARLYRSISSQLAVVVNGLLLLQQTEARARREQVLREITGRVNAAVDAESILRAAAREIGQTLDLEAFVYLTESQGNGHDATS